MSNSKFSTMATFWGEGDATGKNMRVIVVSC